MKDTVARRRTPARRKAAGRTLRSGERRKRMLVPAGLRQGWTCMYCTVETYDRQHAPDAAAEVPEGPDAADWIGMRTATVEHVQRRTDGGRDTTTNAAVACAWCNHVRDDRTPARHRTLMRRLRREGLHPNFVAMDATSPRDARRAAGRRVREIEAERATARATAAPGRHAAKRAKPAPVTRKVAKPAPATRVARPRPVPVPVTPGASDGMRIAWLLAAPVRPTTAMPAGR